MVAVCVVGAGVIGLSSALNIQRTFLDVSVTVVADKFHEETTSYGAGGLFRPNLNQIKGDRETITRWIHDSWHFYDSLARSPEGPDCGTFYVPGFVVYDTPQDDAYEPIKNLVYDFHSMSQEELRGRNFNYKYGYAFTSIIVQPPIYLTWLMRQFLKVGGKVQKRTIHKLEDLSEDFDVVINCCGLNSETLVGEKNAYPVKGQLVHMKAPWIKFFFLSEDDIYIFPQIDRLIVGGTREKGNYDNVVDPKISERIVSRAEKLFPYLKGAEVLGAWSGLRPFCDPIRLEIEVLQCGPKGRLPASQTKLQILN